VRALEVPHPELPAGALIRAEVDAEPLCELEEAGARLHRILVHDERRQERQTLRVTVRRDLTQHCGKGMRVRTGNLLDPSHEIAVCDVRLVASRLLQPCSDLAGHPLPVSLVDLPSRAHASSLRRLCDPYQAGIVLGSPKRLIVLKYDKPNTGVTAGGLSLPGQSQWGRLPSGRSDRTLIHAT
jgi:hypothetical protein